MKKSLRRYLGKLVQLRPNRFSTLLARLGRQGKALENRFLVGATSRRLGKLICYNANLRCEIAPADIVLI